ncbi:MAG: DNA replication/repair protein RecF [Bacillota bacterium]|nr:DNA replication/repair protein RecF [Bacillota bacterium]
MQITKIRLKNFRNYETLDLDVSEGAHVISGMNAQGKSNFIEAIYYSAFSRSFRKSRDKDLIRHGAEQLSIQIDFDSDNREESLAIFLDKGMNKRIKINENYIRKMSDFIGKIKIACFTPEDLYLISGSPGERRRFLNRELSQIYPAYFRNIIDYHLVLNQRNTAIKQYKFGGKDGNLVRMWDDKLAELGEKIIQKRVTHLLRMDEIASGLHKRLSGEKEILKIEYDGIFHSKNYEKYDKIEFGLKELLDENFENDMKYGYTTIGPHKDDFHIFINGLEAKKFASQGQKKLSALSIKLSQIEMIQEITGTMPIVLLDDVSSELDEERRLFLLDYITGFQSFMTTTDIEIFQEERHKFKHITVSNGTIKEEHPCKIQ